MGALALIITVLLLIQSGEKVLIGDCAAFAIKKASSAAWRLRQAADEAFLIFVNNFSKSLALCNENKDMFPS